MIARDNHGLYFIAEPTMPLLFRKARTRRSLGVAKGNRTRRSSERLTCLWLMMAHLAGRV